MRKVIDSNVDYENDLDCIQTNVLLAFKLYEFVFNLKLKQDLDAGREINTQPLTSNLSSEADLSFYINRWEDYRNFWKMKLTQAEVDEYKKHFNVEGHMYDISKVNTLQDFQSDYYQTALKNPLCFKPALFLAELYTEYSRKYPKVTANLLRKLTFGSNTL